MDSSSDDNVYANHRGGGRNIEMMRQMHMHHDEQMMHRDAYSRPKKQNKHHNAPRGRSKERNAHRGHDQPSRPTPNRDDDLLDEINKLKKTIKQLNAKKTKSGKSPARPHGHNNGPHGHHGNGQHGNGHHDTNGHGTTRRGSQHHQHRTPRLQPHQPHRGSHGHQHHGHGPNQTAAVDKIRSVESVHAEWPKLDIAARAALRRKLATEMKQHHNARERKVFKLGQKLVNREEKIEKYKKV